MEIKQYNDIKKAFSKRKIYFKFKSAKFDFKYMINLDLKAFFKIKIKHISY